LIFIGGKFMLSEVVHIGVGLSLLVILAVMSAAIGASVVRDRHEAGQS
jgi:hypothetical protein